MEMKKFTHWLPGKRVKQTEVGKRHSQVMAHLPKHWREENLSAPEGHLVNLAIHAARMLLQKQISPRQFQLHLQEVSMQRKDSTAAPARKILARCELDPSAFVAIKQELHNGDPTIVRLKVLLLGQDEKVLAQVRTQWEISPRKAASRVDQ